MRIAILTNEYPTGSETFVVRHAVGLGANVLTPEVNAEGVTRYGLLGNGIYPFKPPPPRTLFRRAAYRFGSGLPGSVWHNPSTARDFAETLARVDPDVLLAQYGPNGINAVAACRALAIPLVIQFHGYDATSLLKSKAYRARLREALSYAYRGIVVYEGMQTPLIELGIRPAKFEVINVGVPVDARATFERSHGTSVSFLSVGRMVAKKAPLTTLKAFEGCADVYEDVSLTMVGDGPLLSKVRSYAERSRHAARITLTGYLGQPEILQLYRNASAFLQHSVTAANGDREGWPVSVAEAALAGLPIVSTRHAGIVEQVIENVTGYLVAEHDVAGMSAAMTELARHPSRRAQFGEAGRSHIIATGSLDGQLGKLRNVLQRSVSALASKTDADA